MDMRIGHGFDVHCLTENRKLILCGVEIPFEQGLLGHSDADVAAHAVTDALLGAAALAAFIPNMAENLAAVLELSVDRVNVKATTTEKLGFTGRGEGIAAEAVCLLVCN